MLFVDDLVKFRSHFLHHDLEDHHVMELPSDQPHMLLHIFPQLLQLGLDHLPRGRSEATVEIFQALDLPESGLGKLGLDYLEFGQG